MRKLVARSDQCGRVWIEDAEHGRFPPGGLYIQFPQHEAQRDVEATLAIARKMAAAEDLLEAAKDALSAMDDSDEFGLSDAWGDPDKAAKCEALRAAIAKAEEAA